MCIYIGKHPVLYCIFESAVRNIIHFLKRVELKINENKTQKFVNDLSDYEVRKEIYKILRRTEYACMNCNAFRINLNFGQV